MLDKLGETTKTVLVFFAGLLAGGLAPRLLDWLGYQAPYPSPYAHAHDEQIVDDGSSRLSDPQDIPVPQTPAHALGPKQQMQR